MEIDCFDYMTPHQGTSYSHEYENYLNLFRTLGYAVTPGNVYNSPRCWIPFIRYIGHSIGSSHVKKWECDNFDWPDLYNTMADKRRAVEIVSSCRPELVHALYCADTEWPCPLRLISQEKSFVVTNNGSFFRDEVQAYRKLLAQFSPTKRRAVLVPCAADKPYPAPLHQAVMSRLDSSWHIITATGVLGLVPQELWELMPWYDSGLPNLTRCRDTVAWYFTKHEYDVVVVYSDFYAPAIHEGLRDNRVKQLYVLGHHFRDRYENLMLQENLMALDIAVAKGVP